MKKPAQKISKSKLSKKLVYFFGGGKADGKESMKNLLGGKGANLAEMAGHPDLKLPVPPGFTITTELCTYYWANKRTYPKQLKAEVEKNLRRIEALTGKRFGDPRNPLLVSVRSGARSSMPGMMETILNCGLTEATIPGLIELTKNPRFVYDSYRRLIMMYSDVVMEKGAGIEAEDNRGIRKQLEHIMESMKKKRGVKTDTELNAEDLKELSSLFKAKIKEVLGKQFPDNHMDQLWGSIGAVFASWMGNKAVKYREIEKIPAEWGTAVNVQSMVFGNMGDASSTGVAFTRNPGTGEDYFYGEFLENAQGEDVVAGIRTPHPINEPSRSEQSKHLKSMEQLAPACYKELAAIRTKLEKHYRNMLDIEFTVENGRLWMLQCRVGKRNGPAAIRMALDMYREKLITRDEAIARVTPSQLDEMLHPIVDPKAEAKAHVLGKGLPAGPGGAVGQVVFTAAEAVKWHKEGKKVILVREETNPEDVDGMRAAEAILTARGGMTSHAALVARGWGKCCVVGCAAVEIEHGAKQFRIGGETVKEGDWITLNGSKGLAYRGKLEMIDASESPMLGEFLRLCNQVRALKVWTNADTPADSMVARKFGAEGIGLFRIEHMFYGKGSDQALFQLRKMIMSKTLEERKSALNDLFPFMKNDLKATFKVMQGLHVTVRLMDPPLHEFVPHQKDKLQELGKALGISYEELESRAAVLRESNPMMGHRGVRLGITYPEITEMQARAILEAAAELIKEGVKVYPDIMIPVVSLENEVKNQTEIIRRVYAEVYKKHGVKVNYMVGTMIEIPRACLMAGRLAETMEFFSFGTNDLTQMTYGYSRDDAEGKFLLQYVDRGILPENPFQSLDQVGVGRLVEMCVEEGRAVNPD
ncbi:MAG: pyruvate, phosphate dikinase, partial [Elusimicrobiales bacterium]|nr:pyruvate, phosphate dikinase [Elusimicrobiales bacterium]